MQERWFGLAVLLCFTGIARAADWPMWGRDIARNMVSAELGLAHDFAPGEPKAGGDEIDPATTRGVKWVAKLGSQTYGNPTVAAGRVFVGTNNDSPRDPAVIGDRGVVMCFEQATGRFIWQLAEPKLAAGNWCDYEGIGICSSPSVDGSHVYFVTNRCEVVCLEAADGRVVWRYDMRDELGVFPHQATSSAVLVLGDRVFVTTSNGIDGREHMPSPLAPALICLDKKSGRLLGQERSGISRRTFVCNWSSPAAGEVNGKQVVFFGGGDGFCYAFDPEPVDGTLRELWRYDCNPPHRRVKDGQPIRYGREAGPSEILATPVFHEGRIYVATGQNPERGDGDGALSCIDAASGRLIWLFDQIGRSLSTVSVADGLLYIGDYRGYVYCLDAAGGQLLWKHDTQGAIWGSTLVADGKVYVGSEAGFTILVAGREKRVIGQIDFGGPVYSSPVVANGVLYVATERNLYAIDGKETR